MWLINTETLKLESVVNPETVEYAILSHTWEEEEVSFQEFQDLRSARAKKGFSKIKKTCRLAKKHGYRYAWVDTCCIDKSSSAELSEAINSMFRWYKGAKRCYAYLSDYRQTTIDRRFANCRWFTRGWTLQELIAPASLTFYNRYWDALGSKTELSDIISRITRIQEAVLLSECDINTVNVVYRMSWAAGRKTTRPEDIAYCLFGIFDVNLPMLYGEGTKAFLRLQEEICQQVHDLTLFAWKTDTDEEHRGIFARSPEEFAYASYVTLVYEPCSGDVRVSNRGVIFDDMELMVVKGQGLFMPLNLFGKTIPDSTAYVSGGIFLEKTPDGYVRAKTTQLFPTELDGRWLPLEPINVISRGVVAIKQAPMVYVSTLDTITISNVCPRRQWDPYIGTLMGTERSMVELDVSLGNGQRYSLMALFIPPATDNPTLLHDIVDSKWHYWSNALANTGKASVASSWAAALGDHFFKEGAGNQGEGMWLHPTPDSSIAVRVDVAKVERGWQVWISLSHDYPSRSVYSY
ncbi:hypothetical protein CEP54_000850 [Fusarium duplospermum]|uniref:Uncharacterized protein n=1 Tax=Fusarium duplospermum TaxID=1325734 RepID=A0A428R492_9HYPO|nr:hypothetical protein CEP54_000850 [Fusarium duplospermum]